MISGQHFLLKDHLDDAILLKALERTFRVHLKEQNAVQRGHSHFVDWKVMYMLNYLTCENRVLRANCEEPEVFVVPSFPWPNFQLCPLMEGVRTKEYNLVSSCLGSFLFYFWVIESLNYADYTQFFLLHGWQNCTRFIR